MDFKFDSGRLEITAGVLKIVVDGREGFLQNNSRKWQFVQPEPILDVRISHGNGGVRSSSCYSLELRYETGTEIWHLYPHLPFLCTECHPDKRIFRLSSPHIQLTSVEMIDRTDHHDSLVKESVHQHYKSHRARGNMFLLENPVQDSGLLLVKHSPCPDSAVRRSPDGDMVLHNDTAELRGCGYGAAYGIGTPSELFDAYKQLYACLYDRGSANFIMSNTWGDRSRDSAMREEFVLKELECAHHLGVDIVQLDDGWQKGISSNSVHAAQNRGGVFEGFWDFDPDFWELDPEKFPGGMDTILHRAEELEIELGLWFAPDSSGDFSNWQKDVEVIRTLAEKHGARHIKLDGVVLRTEECEKNYLAMLESIRQLRCPGGDTLRFNLDITNDERLGYFCGIPYGTLFVENRYTDWKNYYPHRTLRNLWQLSKYLPASKFQFEVLNPRRNAHLYGDDPLAPANYDIDWCFASVMAANPLIWMEMQHLNDEDTEALRRIIAVYREHREAMADMQVHPVGDLPYGVGWSGFLWQGQTGGYIVLFRGITEESRHTFRLPVHGIRCTVLHSNTDTDICETENGLCAGLAKKRGYVFLQYTFCPEIR